MYRVYFCFSFCYLRFDHTCFHVITWHRKYFGLHLTIHLTEGMFGSGDYRCRGFNIFYPLLIAHLEFEGRCDFGNAENVGGGGLLAVSLGDLPSSLHHLNVFTWSRVGHQLCGFRNWIFVKNGEDSDLSEVSSHYSTTCS